MIGYQMGAGRKRLVLTSDVSRGGKKKKSGEENFPCERNHNN